MTEQPATGPDPRRIAVDADVFVADLLIDGDARTALDVLFGHSWLTVIASDRVIADAMATISDIASERLAATWHDRVEELHQTVDHPDGDHPGLASARAGSDAQLLSYDDRLTSAEGGTWIKGRVELSVRSPKAFNLIFDPATVWEMVGEGAYEGPDRPPRATS